jgi:glycosyltransferase involved in cell wall biosynthesis
VAPFLYAALWARPTRFIADLYDPADVELGDSAGGTQDAASVRRLTRIQAAYADGLLCAGARQLERLQGAVHRRGGKPPALRVVPLGVPAPPPLSRARPLRERFGLAASDTVVLWWGTPWRWLDLGTALRAFEGLAASRPDVKLVITAGAPAGADAARLATTDEARRQAAAAGLLDRTVFFLHAWVPYEERHEYLGDADLGLTLHPAGEEARLAARMRYLDYAWSGLPCVLARGDELGAELAAAGLATLVEPGSPDEVAQAVLELAGDESRRAGAASAGRRLAAERPWDETVRPLAALLEEPGFGSGRTRRRADARGVAGAVAAYYAARLSRRLRRFASRP